MMRALSWLCLAATVLGAAVAGAAERVAVRVGEHPGFSRLVFDWASPVGARLAEAPGQATLRFDRAAELDLARFRADPPPEVSRITAVTDGGGLLVTLTILRGAKLRLSESEGKVVLDVLKPETPTDAPAATLEDRRQRRAEKKGAPGAVLAAAEAARPPPVPPPVPPPILPPARKPDPAKSKGKTAPAAAPEIAASRPPASDTPSVVTNAVPAPEGKTRSSVEAPTSLLPPGPADKAGAQATAAKPETAPEKAAAQNPGAKRSARRAARFAPKPKAKPRAPVAVKGAADKRTGAARAPPRSPPDKGAAATVSTATKPADAQRDVVSVKPAPVLIQTMPAPARGVARGALPELRFEWDGEVAAAAFRRGVHFWLVFDRPPPEDLGDRIRKLAPELAPVEQLDVPGVTVIRLTLPPTLAPELVREGPTWIVDLAAGEAAPGTGITVEVDAGGAPAQVLFHVQGAGRTVSFPDPELGDRIIVVPVTTPGQGLATTREFPQFRALASRQGVVLQPLSDGIQVVATDKAVKVRDADGLIVSYGATLALLKSNVPTPPKGPRLFDLAAWRRGEAEQFRTSKQALQSALAQAEPQRAGVARLNLARFYFAHGLAGEALGVLRYRAIVDPRLARDPEVRLMKGASEFLTENYEGAAEDLFHPTLAGEWEAELWRAAMAAVSLDWPIAANGFAQAEDLIADYAHAVRTRLRLLAAEAGLGIGDAEGAGRFLEAARQDNPSHTEKAQIAFLVARRLRLEGDIETAEKLWQRVAASRHPPSRVRARLALLDRALETGSVTDEQAIEELERLRFAWRGDQFEFALLQRLGDLYVARGDHRKGLQALRQAASYFPSSKRSQAVAQRMRDVFANLYLGHARTELAPLSALALYQEFRELTPPGPRGDEVITRLAERLVEVDLLDRAADILDTQVRYRLHGPAKARVGTRLALIRLLDRQPAKSLEALEVSAAPKLPEDLARERRHLRARALFDLGRGEEALALLGADESADALRLRAGMLRARKDWPAAVVVLERLVPEKPPAERAMTEAEGEAIVGLAVALTMAGERAKLVRLGKSYDQAMAVGPQRETFALLVGDLDPGRVKSIAEELAQVDQVEAFLASYRERLREAAPDRLN